MSHVTNVPSIISNNVPSSINNCGTFNYSNNLPSSINRKHIVINVPIVIRLIIHIVINDPFFNVFESCPMLSMSHPLLVMELLMSHPMCLKFSKPSIETSNASRIASGHQRWSSLRRDLSSPALGVWELWEHGMGPSRWPDGHDKYMVSV